jgi:hypothetical protein
MATAGFEPTVPAHELLQTNALDRVTTGIGKNYFTEDNIKIHLSKKNVNACAGFIQATTLGNGGLL